MRHHDSVNHALGVINELRPRSLKFETVRWFTARDRSFGRTRDGLHFTRSGDGDGKSINGMVAVILSILLASTEDAFDTEFAAHNRGRTACAHKDALPRFGVDLTSKEKRNVLLCES
jgi:hypothetical protein